MGNLISDFTMEQEVAFLLESQATRNLLGYGTRTLRTGAFLETTRDPVLTMLSIGIEKLLKLALGSLEVKLTGQWPSKKRMQSEYGHGSLAMHRTLLVELKGLAVDSTPFVRSAVEAVENDVVIHEMLHALDIYGQWGRSYHLDLLAQAKQDWVGPSGAWTAVENVARKESHLRDLESSAFHASSDSALFNEFLRALNERLAVSVDRLWDCVATCGKNHLLGRCGEVLGHEVDKAMVGRQ